MTLRNLLLSVLPLRNTLAFRLARRVVNDFNGDNNFDMETNGEARFARLMLPHARVAFDVGANRGEWSRLAAAVNPSLHIHAFEPSAATFAALTAAPLPPNVRANPIALGERSEDRDLYVYRDASGANSIYRRNGTPETQQRTERIRVERLDDYARDAAIDRVDFLKIDTEGHEVAVLRGAAGLMAAGRIGVVQFEYGGCYIDARVLLKDVFELVEQTGGAYALFKIFPHELRHVPAYLQTYETFQYSNWAIVHESWQKHIR